MPRITANLPDASALTMARLAAAEAGKPLAHWAGDVLTSELINPKKRKRSARKTKQQ